MEVFVWVVWILKESTSYSIEWDIWFLFPLCSISHHQICYSKDQRLNPSKFNRNISHSFMLQPLRLNCGSKLRRVLIGTSREAFSVNVELKYIPIYIKSGTSCPFLQGKRPDCISISVIFFVANFPHFFLKMEQCCV